MTSRPCRARPSLPPWPRPARSTSTARDGIPGVVDLLTLTGLAASKGEARRTVAEGGVYVNNVRVEDVDHVPSSSDLIAGSWLVLRRGKKRFAGVRMR